MIDLKTFLGLYIAMLNQFNAPKLSESKYQAGFWVIISGQNQVTFMIPIYIYMHIVLLYYMIWQVYIYHSKYKEKLIILQPVGIV